MSGFESNNIELKGKMLLGFMPLEKAQYLRGDWDNALALYIGNKENPECIVLRTQNCDYSCHDTWLLEKTEHITRNSAYKAIGEKILEVRDSAGEINTWSKEEDQYWLEIRTKSKILRFGHHWYDCHYPAGIWTEVDV